MIAAGKSQQKGGAAFCFHPRRRSAVCRWTDVAYGLRRRRYCSRFHASALIKKVVVYQWTNAVLWLCPLTVKETLKWLPSLPIWMQKSFWWCQCTAAPSTSWNLGLRGSVPLQRRPGVKDWSRTNEQTIYVLLLLSGMSNSGLSGSFNVIFVSVLLCEHRGACVKNSKLVTWRLVICWFLVRPAVKSRVGVRMCCWCVSFYCCCCCC